MWDFNPATPEYSHGFHRILPYCCTFLGFYSCNAIFGSLNNYEKSNNYTIILLLKYKDVTRKNGALDFGGSVFIEYGLIFRPFLGFYNSNGFIVVVGIEPVNLP